MRTDIDMICARLLDSDEHSGESAIPQVAQNAVDLIRGLEADALRFRKLVALLQSAYNADSSEFDGFTAYCSMLSGWRNERTVKAEITWREDCDADLNLASVLDKIEMGTSDQMMFSLADAILGQQKEASVNQMDVADQVKTLCVNGDLPDEFQKVADWIASGVMPQNEESHQRF